MRFSNGFSNMTTGAEVGSLISAIHEDPDSVSNENGPDFSILNGIWIGFEMDHLFCLAVFLFLHMQYVKTPMARTMKDDASDVTKIKVFLVFDLDFFFSMRLRFLSLFFGGGLWSGVGG